MSQRIGDATETSHNILGELKEGSDGPGTDPPDTSTISGRSAEAESGESERNQAENSAKSPAGHGGHGAEENSGGAQVDIKHPKHSPGVKWPLGEEM